MEWIVTFPTGVPPEARGAALSAAGISLPDDAFSIPLGDEEISVQITATPAQIELLRRSDPVIDIYPLSEMSPY